MAKLQTINKEIKNNNFWSEDKIIDLKENYMYYSEHKKEAEKHFEKSWYFIRTKAIKLGFQIQKKNKEWTEYYIKELKEKYFYYLEHKEEAENKFQRSWDAICVKAKQLKITSMEINKNCSQFLGCHVAERVLSHVFKDVERMPYGNKGFDFICNKGFKIDVKSSCLHKNNTYTFSLNCNKITDYFLCIGFDNRNNLNPQHIWLIKGNLVDEVKSLIILNTEIELQLFNEYELTDKLNETIDCCNKLKNI